ncbi:MAG: recombinase RecA [Pyrobaculum sp.]
MTCTVMDLFSAGLTVVKGLPGAGKTILVAKAVSSFRRVAWFTFYETEDRLRRFLSAVGVPAPSHIYDLASAADVESAVKLVVDKILEARPEAVVVDGVSALAAEGERQLVHTLFYHGVSKDVPVVLIKEGLDVSPADYVADAIVEVHHRILEGGASYRFVKITKARGRAVDHFALPYVITEEGPVVLPPLKEQKELSKERLTAGPPEIDEALGGGILRGSLVAVVGPIDGLASKMLVLTAVELARRGAKVLYHHHKAYPTFVKFAEALGVRWRREGITWAYHPVTDHKSLEWWYKSAQMINKGGYDVHIADQYELVATTAGVELLVEAARVYQTALTHPVVTVLVFNSYHIWGQVARRIGSLGDYVFYFKPGRVKVYTPESPTPLEFSFQLDPSQRRVVFKKL